MLALKADTLPEQINISGYFGKIPWQTRMSLQGGKNSQAVSVLWARRKIESLMERYRLENQGDAIKQTIIDIALEHHLVSQFTSLVAVDKTPVRAKSERLNSKAIAGQLPVGSTLGQLPQTATSASLQLLLGMLLLLAGLYLWFTQREQV